jgi:hypothetical protein
LLRAAGQFGGLGGVGQFKNNDFVPTLPEPLSGHEQQAQTATVPESAEAVAVDGAFVTSRCGFILCAKTTVMLIISIMIYIMCRNDGYV